MHAPECQHRESELVRVRMQLTQLQTAVTRLQALLDEQAQHQKQYTVAVVEPIAVTQQQHQQQQPPAEVEIKKEIVASAPAVVCSFF